MTTQDITFRTRKWVEPEDLNANGTLFGAGLLPTTALPAVHGKGR